MSERILVAFFAAAVSALTMAACAGSGDPETASVTPFQDTTDEQALVSDGGAPVAEEEAGKPVFEAASDDGATNKSHWTKYDFWCKVTGNNSGCAGDVYCPSGNVKRVKAGCNLESGDVSWSQISSLPNNVLYVFEASDVVDQGACWIDDTVISIYSSSVPITGYNRKIFVGCVEHDNNGGDCVIRGNFWCD